MKNSSVFALERFHSLISCSVRTLRYIMFFIPLVATVHNRSPRIKWMLLTKKLKKKLFSPSLKRKKKVLCLICWTRIDVKKSKKNIYATDKVVSSVHFFSLVDLWFNDWKNCKPIAEFLWQFLFEFYECQLLCRHLNNL